MNKLEIYIKCLEMMSIFSYKDENPDLYWELYESRGWWF